MPVKKDLKRRSTLSLGGRTKRLKLVKAVNASVNSECVVLTLGMNEVGQLGLGPDIVQKNKPSLASDTDVRIVVAGGMHTLCVTSDGKLLSFGCNDEGALGRNTSVEDSETKPGYVDLEGTVVQVSAGDSHSAALLDDGRVFAWGSFRDSNGTMGLTVDGNQSTPLEILPGVKFIKIASGADHLAMLNEDGQLYTCGCGEQGQLGRVPERGASRSCRRGLGHFLVPQLVYSKTNRFDDVWAASYATFAKTSKEEILVFGLNNYNQLGLSDGLNRYHPTLADRFSGKTWVQICGGQHHTLARDVNGAVYALGRYEYGRLGLGENSQDATELTIVPTLAAKRCLDIACGSAISLAVVENDGIGKVYGWGMGTNSQLGNGDNDEDIFIPTLITGAQMTTRNAFKVAAGGQHTAILASK